MNKQVAKNGMKVGQMVEVAIAYGRFTGEKNHKIVEIQEGSFGECIFVQGKGGQITAIGNDFHPGFVR